MTDFYVLRKRYHQNVLAIARKSPHHDINFLKKTSKGIIPRGRRYRQLLMREIGAHTNRPVGLRHIPLGRQG